MNNLGGGSMKRALVAFGWMVLGGALTMGAFIGYVYYVACNNPWQGVC